MRRLHRLALWFEYKQRILVARLIQKSMCILHNVQNGQTNKAFMGSRYVKNDFFGVEYPFNPALGVQYIRHIFAFSNS